MYLKMVKSMRIIYVLAKALIDMSTIHKTKHKAHGQNANEV